jgi:hypothetical protein
MAAFKDGLDQVIDMEYYQQMAMIKNNKSASKVGVESAAPIAQVGPREDETNTQLSVIIGWLKSQLPHLHEEDAKRYSQHLVDDGFDSVKFIIEELTDDDLDFMKKAHRRVLVRHLEKYRSNMS